MRNPDILSALKPVILITWSQVAGVSDLLEQAFAEAGVLL